MIVRRLPSLIPGVSRVPGLLVLLLGIVAMHIGVLWSHSDAGPGAHGAAEPAAAVMRMADHGLPPDPAPRNDHYDVGHEVMHACVFILSHMTLAIGLALLYWFGTGAEGSRLPGPHYRRVDHERSPPWTVPSLAELSILRI
ncbi:DUF6153 family protein [Nocardia sp. 004]|uniref:DUF6153 family protein n=1 Tax=Nocardia sp. 004 TaxID=3385978 RepID=UPI0039A290F5